VARRKPAAKKPAAKAARQCEWGSHQYKDAPSKARPGWIATACVKCGKFLGRRPSDGAGLHKPGEDAPGGRFV